MSRLFTYVITHDGGFAPNPFFGVLTLNCCKPMIRRAAEVGDWVAGFTAADFPAGRGLLVYAMRVTSKMTMSEYDLWTRQNLPEKIPGRGDYSRRAGDGMYDFETDPPTRRRGSFHGPEDMRADLSGRYTLLSREFYYFGGSPVEVPGRLRSVVHTGRAHKWRENSPHVQEFETWIREFDPGLSGIPHQASQFVTIGRR